MFIADRPDRSETRTLTHSDHLAYREVIPCRRQGLSEINISFRENISHKGDPLAFNAPDF